MSHRQLFMLIFLSNLLFNGRVFGVEFSVLERDMTPLNGAVVTLQPVSHSAMKLKSGLSSKILNHTGLSTMQVAKRGLSSKRGKSSKKKAMSGIIQCATDVAGNLSMKVPSGEYNIVIWHPRFRKGAVTFLTNEYVTNQKDYSIRLKDTLYPEIDIVKTSAADC